MKSSRNITGRVDAWLVLATTLLLALSILMVFSATAVTAEKLSGDSTSYIRKHLLAILVGLISLVSISRMELRRLQRISTPFLALVSLLLVIVLIPGIGHTAGGASRWLALGSFRVQPGELIKVACIIFFATYIEINHALMRSFKWGVFIPLIIVGVLSGLLLVEPDFGSTVILLTVVFCQLLTVSRISQLAGIGVLGLLTLGLVAIASPYRVRRLVSFLDPFGDASNAGYQLVQSLIAVGSGGLFGVGLGAGKQKLFYLPAAHTDFIFALISEELGLVGALGVLILFLIIGLRGLRIAKSFVDDPYLCSLCVGCTGLIVIPALLNMGVVLGLLPTKGLVLPLVAYGGTAMVVNLSAMGVLLRLSRSRA